MPFSTTCCEFLLHREKIEPNRLSVCLQLPATLFVEILPFFHTLQQYVWSLFVPNLKFTVSSSHERKIVSIEIWNFMVQNIIWKADCHSAYQKKSFLYWTRRFITGFTKAHHWTLSWDSWIQFTPSIPISLKSSLMLSSHICLGLPSGLLPSGFPTKTL